MFKINTKKGLGEILSGFTKTLNELESFVAEKREENAVIQQEIIAKQQCISENNTDIAKADGAIKNLKNILGE